MKMYGTRFEVLDSLGTTINEVPDFEVVSRFEILDFEVADARQRCWL